MMTSICIWNRYRDRLKIEVIQKVYSLFVEICQMLHSRLIFFTNMENGILAHATFVFPLRLIILFCLHEIKSSVSEARRVKREGIGTNCYSSSYIIMPYICFVDLCNIKK